MMYGSIRLLDRFVLLQRTGNPVSIEFALLDDLLVLVLRP
jgi:hypothetical protein